MTGNGDKGRIEKLKTGDEPTLKGIYTELFNPCREWVNKRFSIRNEEFEDIFQDAVIILYEAAIDGKLDNLKCNLKTYLFAICRNQLLKKHRLEKRVDAKELEIEIHFREWMEDATENIKAIDVKNQINQLNEPCKSILTMAYYHNSDGKTIADELEYSSKEALKVQKSRCLKYLKQKIELLWKKTLS
ncbi:MAG: sigma-70 family RNA polymerase sigma factor [Cyclobacteriaceae bacterium]